MKLNEKRAELPECSEYKDLKAEIQIRTIIENAWAEIEHHWNYKPDNEDDQLDGTLQRRLNGLMAVLELIDREFDLIRESYQDKFKSDEIMLNTISELARSPDLFEDICKYLYDNERYEELVYFTKEAVTKDQNNRKILRNMVMGLLKLDNYEETLKILEKLINLEPNIAILYIGKGYAFSRLDKHAKALMCYDRALILVPKNVLALYNKGVSLAALGEFEEADSAYQEALKLYKELAEKNPDAYIQDVAMVQNNIGLLYRKLERFEEAESMYQETLKIYKELAEKNPNKYKRDVAKMQNNLGALYTDLRRFEEAEIAYQKVLEIDSRKSITWFNKACLESLRNVREKAIEYLKRAIELDEKNIELAKSDKDFDNIRTSKEFKELIGE